MSRKKFRPRAVSGSTVRSRRSARHALPRRAAAGSSHLRSRALIAGAVILVAAVAWVAVQLLRPVPSMALTVSVTTARVLPGAAPRPDWPGRAQAAAGLPGTGLLGAHGGSQPVPIASLAKIMTGYVVLSDHPLRAGGSGPVITVTAADAAAYASDQRQGQSVVKVAAGETLTERQALEAMLIPSGNNIASLLAALGRRLARGVRGEDERPGALARAAQYAIRGRQRGGPGHGEHGQRPVPAHPARPADPGVPPDRGHAAGHPAGRRRGLQRQCRPRARRDRGRQDRLNLAGGRVPGLRRDPDGRRRPGHDHRRHTRRARQPPSSRASSAA